jgi:hypothetical protein
MVAVARFHSLVIRDIAAGVEERRVARTYQSASAYWPIMWKGRREISRALGLTLHLLSILVMTTTLTG